jgi:NADPH:quinone reductase-like Zn-dependent oxidoreductase
MHTKEAIMKSAIVTAPGATPVYSDIADPTPAAGEVHVAVSAAALSHVARGRASGRHYSSSGQFPFVPGVDGVGRLADGARVYFAMPEAPNGSFAEQTIVSDRLVVPLPADIDDVTAAAIANPGMSSWAALVERAKLSDGETVLINGATGLAGRLAVKIARHLGAGKVIATGRNTDVLEALEADVTIPIGSDRDTLEQTLMAQFAQGVDVVIDYLWGQSAETLLIAAAKASPEGRPVRFVAVGSASGQDIALPGAVLRSSAIAMMGSGIGSVSPARLLAAVAGVLNAASVAGLTADVATVPLSDIERVWTADNAGRTVFTMGKD